MTPRPDPRLLAASHLVENLATKIAIARLNIRAQINAIGQLNATTYDNEGRGGERTILVPVDCPGERPCNLGNQCGLAKTGKHTHPCRTPGKHTHPEAVPVTPVEDYVIRRHQLEADLADLDAHAKAIATIAANALRDADRLIGTHLPGINIPRCNATGRDGAITWSHPECTNVPTRGPICDRCSKAEYRWRTSHGLPPRRDGVFSTPRAGAEVQ